MSQQQRDKLIKVGGLWRSKDSDNLSGTIERDGLEWTTDKDGRTIAKIFIMPTKPEWRKENPRLPHFNIFKSKDPVQDAPKEPEGPVFDPADIPF